MSYDEHETRELWWLRTWVIGMVYALAICGILAVTVAGELTR